ncbi:MAG: type VI secretion system baseplate subunit TssG [Minicystis sp.]
MPSALAAAPVDPKEQLAAIERDARRSSFYRLVYLLERVFPKAPPVGQLGPVSEERVRLRADVSLIFASCDVSEVSNVKNADGVERVRVTNAFMGLYGSSSPMPPSYVEKIALDDYQGGPQPVREFLDVFHHRLLSLLYRAWSKYRFSVMYRQKGKDPFTRRMFCAVGLDGMKDAETVLDRFLYLRYAPLLASKSRSARGLQVVLDDLFGAVGVKIEQFVGHWTLIEKPNRNKLGVMNHQLGESLTIGRYVYDGTGRFNVILGPLSYDDYLSFLPGGHRRPLLRAAIGTFTRGQHDVMLELHVKTDDAPRLQLGSQRSATLKRTAWLGGKVGQQFKISVPLEDKPNVAPGDEEDEDRGEPPPDPREG